MKNIDRFQEIPHEGPMCDYLWSDPEDIDEWEQNPRGAGVIFGNKLITIWSAPNYCYRCNNIAAILQLDENLRTNYITFNASPENNKQEPEKMALPEYFL